MEIPVGQFENIVMLYLQESFRQTRLSTKALEKSHASRVSDGGVLEGKSETSEAFRHFAESSPREVSEKVPSP